MITDKSALAAAAEYFGCDATYDAVADAAVADMDAARAAGNVYGGRRNAFLRTSEGTRLMCSVEFIAAVKRRVEAA